MCLDTLDFSPLSLSLSMSSHITRQVCRFKWQPCMLRAQHYELFAFSPLNYFISQVPGFLNQPRCCEPLWITDLSFTTLQFNKHFIKLLCHFIKINNSLKSVCHSDFAIGKGVWGHPWDKKVKVLQHYIFTQTILA